MATGKTYSGLFQPGRSKSHRVPFAIDVNGGNRAGAGKGIALRALEFFQLLDAFGGTSIADINIKVWAGRRSEIVSQTDGRLATGCRNFDRAANFVTAHTGKLSALICSES